MKKVKFFITNNNFTSRSMARGITAFPSSGYLFTHSEHPGREFVVSHPIFVDNRRGQGWGPNTKTWAAYDRVSGYRVVGKRSFLTRAEALDAARGFLSVTSPEAFEQSIHTRRNKLAAFILEQ